VATPTSSSFITLASLDNQRVRPNSYISPENTLTVPVYHTVRIVNTFWSPLERILVEHEQQSYPPWPTNPSDHTPSERLPSLQPSYLATKQVKRSTLQACNHHHPPHPAQEGRQAWATCHSTTQQRRPPWSTNRTRRWSSWNAGARGRGRRSGWRRGRGAGVWASRDTQKNLLSSQMVSFIHSFSSSHLLLSRHGRPRLDLYANPRSHAIQAQPRNHERSLPARSIWREERHCPSHPILNI